MSLKINSRSVSLVVHNNFLHDSRVLKIAKSLKRFGYEVVVVALFDEGLEKREVIDGISVYRIEVKLRRWSLFKFLRIFRYIEFAFRFLLEVPRSHYYHCNDIYTMPLAILLKLRSWKCQVIYDAHEFESDHTPHQSVFKTLVLQWIESFLIRFSNKMMTVSDSIAEEYAQLYGIQRPYAVYNTPYKTTPPQSDKIREELGIGKDQKIFLYQGVLGIGRGIDILIEAFSEFESNKNVLVFLGYGHYQKKVELAAHQHQNIYYLPAVSFEELPFYTASADFGVCLIEPMSKSYELCMPNKLFEYLMAGLPVLVSNVKECRHIVENYDVGVAVENFQLEEIHRGIHRLVEFSETNELHSRFSEVIEKYNWSAQEAVLRQIYH